MSKQSAKECLERIESDPTFRAKLLKAKTHEERKKVLDNHNFHFTQDDYKQAFQEKHHHPLNEQELRKLSAAGSLDTSNVHAILGSGKMVTEQ